ncbi:Hypothetical predicted protein [Paramuricea clavata]|uniref:Uncharacterized protein n=1 Tax=Paramuricea clavata TaxID=317549 RepID=A0A7D9DST6_PARCT|nr:Hypothetical predicted protein [Paramuricea clavata]
MAELVVQAKSLEIQQRLEQEKLRIQQEKAKSAAKEKALAALQILQSTTMSTNLFDVRQSPAVVKSPPRHQTPRPHSTGRKLPQLPLISKANKCATVEKPVKQQDSFKRHDQPEREMLSQNNTTLETMLRLQEQQNDLNLQEN